MVNQSQKNDPRSWTKWSASGAVSTSRVLTKEYNVVFRTIVKCETTGAITWTTFRSKEDFDKWNNDKMKSWYEVVAEGVSEATAIELCSSPEATRAVEESLRARQRQALERLSLMLAGRCPDCGRNHNPECSDCVWGE